MDILLQIVTDKYIMAFCAIMVGTIIYFRKVRHQQVNTVASIVTVFGVLGTFGGIAWGLYKFDKDNIEASVPKLLDGLEFAFITSIVGIGLSIWLKWSSLNKRKKQAASEETYTGATVDDLAELLGKILAVEQEERSETRATLIAIQKALTEEGGNPVVTQLQKLRTTFSDKQEDLIRAFNEFATQMAENNTEALIEALENVMRDFNAKINEQFGDNFKQLNEAVGRINEWQEQYRQQMNELAEQFKVAAASIEKSRESLEDIAKQNGIIVSHIDKSKESLEVIACKSGAIVSSAEELGPILQAIQDQIKELGKHLEVFEALSDKASNVFPTIKANLDKLTDGFSTAVKETITNSDKSIEAQRKALADQSEQLKTTGTESTNLMAMQITALDTALQKDLTKALESLGSQLTSLSKKFVEDYTPLTAKLHEVLNMVDGLPEPSP